MMETRTERLRRNVAKILCASHVPLTRTAILEKVDKMLINGTSADVDQVSMQLNTLKKNAHVESVWGNKWQITPRGRSFWSELNDDPETPTKTYPLSTITDNADHDLATDKPQPGQPGLPGSTAQPSIDKTATNNPHADKPASQLEPLVSIATAQTSPRPGAATMAQSAAVYTVEFDLTDPDDAALARIVNAVREATAAPAIERKTEKLAVLAQYSDNPLILPEHRSVFFDIQRDLEQFEDIA